MSTCRRPDCNAVAATKGGHCWRHWKRDAIGKACARCGCAIERPFWNRRGEAFCSEGHRSVSNAARRRLLMRANGKEVRS